MIFNRLEDRTFFSHLSKRKIIISSLLLSALLLWSILIQTTLKPADDRIVHEISEVVAVEFKADLSYVKQFAEDSEKAKIERLFSQFDQVLNADGSYIFLSIGRDSPKNPKNN